MADRHDYYFGEVVTESELDEGFDFQEQADWDQNKDAGLTGLVYPSYDVAASWPTLPVSWTVRENSPADFKVIVDTGYGYNKDGKRLAVDPPTSVVKDCSVDYLGASNAVAAGKSRWISIFLKFDRILSDIRTDDDGLTIYFLQTESYELEVRQGPEEAYPATTKPVLDSSAILICDILIDDTIPPINNADIFTTRTEALVNLDISSILTGGGTLFARNLEEALAALAAEVETVLTPIGTTYLRRDGGNTITGNIEPDTDDTRYFGGGKNYFKGIFTSAFSERPTDQSFGAVAAPDSSLDVLPTHPHWSVPSKTIGGLPAPGTTRRRRDLVGRDHRIYHVEREDFNWPNAWTGTPGVETRWKQILTAGGTVIHNPATFSQLLAGGFAQTNVFAAIDGVDIYADGWIYRADLEPYMVIQSLPQTLTATAAVFLGMRGATGNFFGFMYDPTNNWGYGIGNQNLWAIYDDGINTALAFDTSQAYTVGIAHRLAVAIEYDNTNGRYWLVFYKDNSSVYSFNLTDGGGTYQAQALGEIFDLYYLLRETAAATSRVLLDFFEGQQNLDS